MCTRVVCRTPHVLEIFTYNLFRNLFKSHAKGIIYFPDGGGGGIRAIYSYVTVFTYLPVFIQDCWLVWLKTITQTMSFAVFRENLTLWRDSSHIQTSLHYSAAVLKLVGTSQLHSLTVYWLRFVRTIPVIMHQLMTVDTAFLVCYL